jgi:uncharacterized protein (DUF3820 family)
MALTELEQKLMRLALDPAAAPGEIENCARKLFEQWRKRGLTIEQILGEPQAAAANPEYWAPDYGLCVMPFGKHKTKEFKDIPPSYLRWLKQELEQSPNQKFPNLLEEITNFLNQ